MEVYLDNAATTRAVKPSIDAMVNALEINYGNPSSAHNKGIEAETALKYAKGIAAQSLKVSDKDIVFTSGGTEANNMALIGAAAANKRKGRRIITSPFEHASVSKTLLWLKDEGFEIAYAPVDSDGRINEGEFVKLLNDDVIIVSIMYVNNEIGSLQDVGKLSRLIKKADKNIIFHVDGIQAYGKYKIRPKNEGIDLLTTSGHKIHGPKGIGFLYIDEKIRINPILHGGEQQRGIRPGTENIPAAMGMAAAIKECYKDFDIKVNRMYMMKEHLIKGLMEIDNVIIHGSVRSSGRCLMDKIKETAPHIINASFIGIKSEVLLNSLNDKKIYVSSGSACAANNKHMSTSIKAIGAGDESADSAIRFSLSHETSEEEIEYVLNKLNEIVPVLRRYIRK